MTFQQMFHSGSPPLTSNHVNHMERLASDEQIKVVGLVAMPTGLRTVYPNTIQNSTE